VTEVPRPPEHVDSWRPRSKSPAVKKHFQSIGWVRSVANPKTASQGSLHRFAAPVNPGCTILLDIVSTDAVRPSEKFGYWHDVVCSVFTRVDCKEISQSPVHGRVKVTEAGVLSLCETESSPLEYRREPPHIRAVPTDHFLVNYMLRGRCQISQAGECSTQEEGDIVLFDTSRPYLLRYPIDVQKLTVEIPRATLLSRAPNAERAMAKTLSRSSPLVALAGSVLREVARQGQIEDARMATSIGGLVADVVVAALQAEVAQLPRASGRHAVLLERLKAYLLKNLGNPDVSIETLAAAHSIGERTVNRLFAAEGTIAMRWLWSRRLAASYRALSEGDARQVTTVALGYGFTNFSHFSRSFKKTYGIQPNVLARSADERVAPSPAVLD
jgi:AraC-like DNA-binding protein